MKHSLGDTPDMPIKRPCNDLGRDNHKNRIMAFVLDVPRRRRADVIVQRLSALKGATRSLASSAVKTPTIHPNFPASETVRKVRLRTSMKYQLSAPDARSAVRRHHGGYRELPQ